MWRDEVRAFSVATQAASWPALVSSLHQEGHPILWYAILRIGYTATHSNLVLPVTALIIAAIAAFLVLRFAPFPFWVRLLTVFGVFLGYEYSVVARNYGIGIVFMLAACVALPSRHERPIPLGVALALLANTSVHATFASLIIGFVWSTDVLQPSHRSALFRPASVAAFAIAVAGICVALVTAHPSADLAWAISVGQLDAGQIVRLLIADPGRVLIETIQAGVTSGVSFWARIGVDRDMVSKAVADFGIIWLAWSLRRDRVCLAGMVLAIFGFEMIFRLVYPGALRHEGILVFVLISLVWIACSSPTATAKDRRAISLGLLPLLIAQTIALPVLAYRDFTRPESSGKAFGALIRQDARYGNAIVMGEPDYMMETVAYYVPNRIYMPRQEEFQHRVYFDRGAKRRLNFNLGALTQLADSLSCTSGRPVLLAISDPKVLTDSEGEDHPAYRGTVFRWNSAERARLLTRARLVSSFTGATTDENYRVFEIAPEGDSACGGRRHE